MYAVKLPYFFNCEIQVKCVYFSLSFSGFKSLW